jgi:hypothetical protein
MVGPPDEAGAAAAEVEPTVGNAFAAAGVNVDGVAAAGADFDGADEVATSESCNTGLITPAEGLRGVAGGVSPSRASGPGEYGAVADESFSLAAEVSGGRAGGFGGSATAAPSEVAREDAFGRPELPRPSEYPKPKKTPQISTRPKKTPSNDFIPRVISVSLCSCSSVSSMDLII